MKINIRAAQNKERGHHFDKPEDWNEMEISPARGFITVKATF
jgi:hypothetical protein